MNASADDFAAFRAAVRAAAAPDPLPIPRLDPDDPFGAVEVRAEVPGSKSLTNRHLVLAALAAGTTRLEGVLRSDDCDRLTAALEALGAVVRRDGSGDGASVSIEGTDGRPPRGARVDLGDGGTPTRFMIAVGALAADEVTVDGSPRMRERPVADGLDLVRRLGGRAIADGAREHLPVRVGPVPEGGLPGGTIEVGRTASSQFVSATMLVAPWTRGGVELRFVEPPTSEAYLELTLEALRAWAIEVHAERTPAGALAAVRVPRGPVAAPAGGERTLRVEADASSAIYPAVLAALLPGARIVLPLDAERSAQPDARAILALRRFGAEVAIEDRGGARCTVVTGPAAGLRSPGELDAEAFPDGAMALAAMAACLPAPLRITGLHTLRIKETDRIAALAAELARIGARVEATDDDLFVDPSGGHDRPVVIGTYDDHRMAMAFATIGLVRGGISIADPACVGKSHPGFWRATAALRS